MKIIAKNDHRIKQSYQTKKIGGYINFITPQITDENEQFIENNDTEFKFDLIYDSMGNPLNSNEKLNEKINELKNHIDINEKLPRSIIWEDGKRKQNLTEEERKEKELGKWYQTQQTNYKGNKYSLNGTTRPEERKLWEEFMTDSKYKKYF